MARNRTSLTRTIAHNAIAESHRHEWRRVPKPPFVPGQTVTCNGYPGTVVRLYSEGMVEVRLQSGLVCVPANAPDCVPR